MYEHFVALDSPAVQESVPAHRVLVHEPEIFTAHPILKRLFILPMRQHHVRRVRPIVMTFAAIVVGLIPIMFGEGTGSEVMQRIAGPMIGGMISSLILTLLVIPAIYFLWKSNAGFKPLLQLSRQEA